MLDDCQRVYRSVSATSRRMLNQRLFTRLYVTAEGIAGADLAPPFTQLLDDDLEGRLAREVQGIYETAAEEPATYQPVYYRTKAPSASLRRAGRPAVVA